MILINRQRICQVNNEFKEYDNNNFCVLLREEVANGVIDTREIERERKGGNAIFPFSTAISSSIVGVEHPPSLQKRKEENRMQLNFE